MINDRTFKFNGKTVVVKFQSLKMRRIVSEALKHYSENFKDSEDNSELTANYYKTVADAVLEFKDSKPFDLAHYKSEEFEFEFIDMVINDFLLKKLNA
jgi:hypothetical protein